MQMFVIWSIAVILACLPLLMAAFFLAFTLPRKIFAVKQDLSKLTSHKATDDSMKSNIATESEIEDLAKQFFGKLTLSVPALLLTLFYLALFALCNTYLNVRFNSRASPWFFPERFVTFSRPILYSFVGVYLFTLGTIVRRIYLGDLNEQVFWGAINRLWLSLGLSLVVLKTSLVSDSEATFFAIGFLANIFLDKVLSSAMKSLNLGKPKSEDLPLQMVKGINIWKEYRLEEEGIENVQNLATADVTELTVRTHLTFEPCWIGLIKPSCSLG